MPLSLSPAQQALYEELISLCSTATEETPVELARARSLLDAPGMAACVQGSEARTDQNGDPYEPPLPVRLAAERDLPGFLELFAERGALLGRKAATASAKSLDCMGASPLEIACRSGSYRAAKKLLELGSDPNWVNFAHGERPLHAAARRLRPQTFALLAAHGADLNAPGHNELSPLMCYLHQAVNTAGSERPHGPEALAGLDALIELGAQVNQAGGLENGLHYSASSGLFSGFWTRALIERGADVNAPGSQGWTPLMWACLEDHEDDPSESVWALLDAGADPSLKDARGEGPGDNEYANPFALAAISSWREARELRSSTPPGRGAPKPPSL